jgi:mannose-6-phosphate isomerase-like protein (cupin superfamily)
MHTYLPAGAIPLRPNGTLAFEGEAHGSGVSVFLVNALPGTGPVLHRHPYSETWFMRAGRAAFVAGDETLEAGPGDILVVGPGTPHKFTSLGPDRLDLICIHDSPRFIQEDLETR